MFPTDKPGSPAELVEHFGTKGMHWGIRKERETSNRKPSLFEKVGSKRQARREAKAKPHDIAAGKLQSQIDQIKANPSKWRYVQRQRNNQVKQLEKFRDQHIKDAKDIRAGHLTTHQKHVLIGVGVVGAGLAVYGAHKWIDSGGANQFATKRIPFNRNSQLARKMSADEIMRDVVAPINPNYGARGTKMNCRRATFAYEMRRRGLDVKATHSGSGTGQTVAGLLNATDPHSEIGGGRIGIIKAIVKEAKQPDVKVNPGPVTKILATSKGLGKNSVGDDTFSTKDGIEKTRDIFRAIGQHGDGARGELGVVWGGPGGGHSMAWEMIGGQPHIFDTQTGIDYSFSKFASEMGGNIDRAGVTRLDNVNLNTGFLRKWVTNA